MDKSIYYELFAAGLLPLPIIWDERNKVALTHPEHELGKVIINKDYIDRLFSVEFKREHGFNFNAANGCALKIMPPLAMVDFDIKNTDNKEVFDQWFTIIKNTNDEVLRKICIERTRRGGYHVYFKYAKVDHKIAIARRDGQEVISIYTGGLLSYCYPTPGYEIIHNDFADIDFITDEEYELFVGTAALFNEDKDFVPGDKTVTLVEYPTEYESLCLGFDKYCTDEVFETLLNSIDLFEVKDKKYLFKNKKYTPYLRKGSDAVYSAKAYFKSKRLLIFSASMTRFPTWHDSERSGDSSWVLTPAKIVYYKNDRRWEDAVAEIKMISDSSGLDVAGEMKITNLPLQSEDRLKFPYDIFPVRIQNFINLQVIQHEYLAGSILAAISTAIGNTAVLEASDGYIVKPILYLAIVAPPGASKTPALSKCFKPLEDYDSRLYKKYELELMDYKQKYAEWERDKNKTKPEKPDFPQIIIKDSTIEMVVKILSHNKMGCCVFADELSGFLKRMNQYKAGDEVQKWLELWSGDPILLQRISRDENKVENPFCTVVGGIQPGVLESLSKDENEHNGFYHRFLFVYPEPQKKVGWQPLTIPASVKEDYVRMFNDILEFRNVEHTVYTMDAGADELYGQWFGKKNEKYNRSLNDHVKGIIAKYQNYCLRFALIIQIMYDGRYRPGLLLRENMERAIRLTEYFFGNMNKAIKILNPETPADKLPEPYKSFYAKLPENFTTKTAIQVGVTIGIKEGAVKVWISRNHKTLFAMIEKGKYEKIS